MGLQVKNIGFTGVFRLIFKPLVDDFPCFGAVCFSLREKVKFIHSFLHTHNLFVNLRNLQYLQRNLDFTLKVIGGDLSSIPGLSDAIEV